jgi:arsenate reductase-like glutaredoxin family protein
MIVNIEEIKYNDKNPRVIKDYKFQKLVKSIKDFPEMLEKRPIVVDENMVVLGGNMRLRACHEVQPYFHLQLLVFFQAFLESL